MDNCCGQLDALACAICSHAPEVHIAPCKPTDPCGGSEYGYCMDCDTDDRPDEPPEARYARSAHVFAARESEPVP